MLITTQQFPGSGGISSVLQDQARIGIDLKLAARRPQTAPQDLRGNAMCRQVTAQDLGFQGIGGGIDRLHGRSVIAGGAAMSSLTALKVAPKLLSTLVKRSGEHGMNKLGTMLVAAAVSIVAASAQAQDYRQGIDESPSSAAMAFDLVVVRPLGLVATVGGIGLFVLSLPFAVLQGEPPQEQARKFIVEPARFTFDRPLGDME